MKLWLALVVGMSALSARAEGTGQSEPAVQSAITQWLSGQEDVALPALSGLAGSGNVAAQTLLGLIDITASFQGQWLASLPRAERIALMRQPGGLSGRGWLSTADGDLAALWRRLLDTSATPQVVLDFVDQSEDRAAVFAARTLKRRQNRDLLPFLAERGIPDYLYHYAGREWAVHEDDPAWAPIAALCTEVCSDQVADCRAAVADALGGDISLAGPPSRQIIPMDLWAESRMAKDSLLRGLSTSGWRGDGPECLKDALPR